MRKTIFLAGVYGVGKTTICNMITKQLNIQCYSASNLISSENEEIYGKNKLVKNSTLNQEILVKQVNNINDYIFILDGHFCIKGRSESIILLDESIYPKMNVSAIILLFSEAEMIHENLSKRDNNKYNLDFINKLMIVEERQATKVSNRYNIPLWKVALKYDDSDLEKVIAIISTVIKGE